ncbi:MAG: permease [Gammaproteobacteria bacterium]|nr:MAG: permease [Gammaproteobacteria bacterium]
MLTLIGLAIGVIIGLVLGLTGAGGSIFALPLLVLIPGLDPHEGVGIALGAVAASALFGTITRLKSGEIEWLPAGIFALIGALASPIGVALNQKIDDQYILIGFTCIVLYVAQKMWRKATQNTEHARVVKTVPSTRQTTSESNTENSPNTNQPTPKLTSKSLTGMFFGGALTGILSGLFGVGGGFIIVPTLILLTGIPVKHAVATSLVIITAVSSSAFFNFLAQGAITEIKLLVLVSIGGILGMSLGVVIAKKISGPLLQKFFSVSMIVLTSIMVIKHFN